MTASDGPHDANSFGGGTVSGAPKAKAMEVGDELESDKRGI